MTITIKTKYLGDLRVESCHLKSGVKIITDAPIDNKGKGESFSPIDLLATSLASCMLTIMGIQANANSIDIKGVSCEVTKIMSASPRMVSEIVIEFNFLQKFLEKEKEILKNAAHSCPVALSLNENLKQTIIFNF